MCQCAAVCATIIIHHYTVFCHNVGVCIAAKVYLIATTHTIYIWGKIYIYDIWPIALITNGLANPFFEIGIKRIIDIVNLSAMNKLNTGIFLECIDSG